MIDLKMRLLMGGWELSRENDTWGWEMCWKSIGDGGEAK